MRASAFLLISLCILTLPACTQQQSVPPARTAAADPYRPVPYVKLRHPEWAKNAVIYQLNTRQFTPEGTFRAAEAHLPRLKELGVDIPWLMPSESIRMTFVSNHDKNAWEGTEFEQFGPAMVLSAVGEGMPLVYNGREAGNTRRLQFFEKDPVEWKEHPNGELYRKLFALKKRNTALWNGQWGATMILVPNSAPAQVFSFVRRNEQDKVFVVLNFSPRPQTVTFKETLYHGPYTDYLAGQPLTLDASTRLQLKPWDYRVFVR